RRCGSAWYHGSMRVGRKRWWVGLVLGAILLLGAALRWHGQLWDGGALLHPDERHITIVAVDDLRLPVDGDWLRLLDPFHSPLNPRTNGLQYRYGTLPLYLATGGAWLVALAAGGPGAHP